MRAWCVGACVALSGAAGGAFAQSAGFSVKGGGPSGLPGAGVYEEGGVNPAMQVGGEGGMGLPDPGDEIDAMSADQEEEDFLLCTSTADTATGVPSLLRIPSINLFDQAQLHQQAGDTFISTEAWNATSGIIGPPVSLGLFNNVLGRNQAAPYVNASGLQPIISPNVPYTGQELDDIDALTMLMPNPFKPEVIELFFSVSQQSPSLTSLGGTSGGDVFYDPDINSRGDERIYATVLQLGLQPGDELDALVVFDRAAVGGPGDRVYNPGVDRVFFSLRENSPSLDILNATPGDVLLRVPGGIIIFARHNRFGLNSRDELDGLAFDRLIGNSAEITIDRLVPPCTQDWNFDGVINSSDFLAYLNDYAMGKARADLAPPGGNGILNSSDFLAFLNIYLQGCE
ncbi:MAG: GC-type dockerin domain-anchored protein [Phycisphaerales bacterium]|jgi:hypothetical protein|nr:GC-type dockerin domain-anchored protein [Phycisphaerales bacterium]